MRVELARLLDRLMGKPLCAVLSLALRWKNNPAQNSDASPRNVLFIELSEMGSAVLAEPAMRKMRDMTGAELFFVVFERNAEALEITGTVSKQNIFTIRDVSIIALPI